jgi:membrane-bound metal-dependent hydrolase YbcI (DUF457 family)
MDIITHTLTGIAISKYKEKVPIYLIMLLMIGCLLPDIGEIPIQMKISEKVSSNHFIYDSRTSDQFIASQKNITWLYDLTHSILISVLIFTIGYLLRKSLKLKLIDFTIGQTSHIFLDSFSHGKVWALKLFYPILNTRFKILDEKFGNWWDFTPKIKLPFINFQLPIICLYFWIIILLIILTMNAIRYKKRKKNANI